MDYTRFLFHFEYYTEKKDKNAIGMDPELVRSASEYPHTVDCFAEGLEYEKVITLFLMYI